MSQTQKLWTRAVKVAIRTSKRQEAAAALRKAGVCFVKKGKEGK